MALVCPGSSTTALALLVPVAATGKNKLDPKLAAILNQCEVRSEDMDKLGDGGCLTVGVYARVGLNEAGFMKYVKDVLGLDPPNDGTAAIPAAKLIMAWDACRKRTEVEIENSAHRAANHLPPQLSVDDFPTARLALEKLLGKEFDDHKLPSENYLEKKIGEIETVLRPEKLVMVSSFAQEERQRTPNSVEQAMHFDAKGHPVMRTQKRDFFVQMPTDEHSLRNRFEIMGAMLEMLKMKYMSNGIISTASLGLMREYVEWLCGKNIWGYVVKGSEGKPISCPSLNMVLN